MGPGGSQLEATFDLVAPVRAGTYHVECDAIIIHAVDVTFALIWRRGTTDTPLATWSRHWEPLATGYDAQAYEVDQAAPEIAFQPGDQLVFRYAGAGSAPAASFIPNGDGAIAHGRIPRITLP